MPRFCAAILAVAIAVLGVVPAQAQFPFASPGDNMAAIMRDALVSPYGRLMIAEFNTVLRQSALPECLQSKDIKPAELQKRGEALFVKWSIRAIEAYASFINLPLYELKLGQSAGVGVAAEMKRLEASPDVKRYLAIERPRRLAFAIDTVAENFSRYVLIHRVKFGQISPLATGNESLLLANPTDKVTAELERFLKASKSAQLKRYLELSEAVVAALTASLNTQQVRDNFSPKALFGGVEKDLGELCVSVPQ